MPLRSDLLWGLCDERLEAERELDRLIALPVQWRSEWAAARSSRETLLVRVRDVSGRVVGGIVVESIRARALPGHRSYLISRLGVDQDPGALRAALDEFSAHVRKDRRVLSVHAFQVTRDPDMRSRVGSELQRIGFTKERSTSYYDETFVVDLRPSEDAMLASFKSAARRDIKRVASLPVEIVLIDEPRFAPRLAEIWSRTLERTGGGGGDLDWPSVIQLTRAAPAYSRIVGLRRTGSTEPTGLLSFVWGCLHGDHVAYEEGASTRPEDLKIGLAHAPMWELMRWGKERGASWFDLGGVRDGAGVSRFKASFGASVEYVREGWDWVPRPFRNALARHARSLAGRARSVLRR